MTQKKIGFLLGKVSRTGGISRVCSIISNELVKTKKYQIHVFSFHPREMQGYYWSPQIEFHNLLEEKLTMRNGFVSGAKSLKALLEINDIDLLIVCGHNVGPLAVFASFFNKSKLIYWPHSSFYGYKTESKKFNERFTSFLSSAVVTLTQADRTNYTKKTWAKKVIHIYNPIDPSLDKHPTLHSPESRKIISVGRITKSKQFELVIDIAKLLLKSNTTFTWDIYGSGEDEPELKAKIRKEGMGEFVQLMGHCSDIYSKYKNYSLLVMTSKFEGFPMSLLEGMANGLPLVSFDVATGPNEIIRNGHNGYLIQPFNLTDMSDKIIHLLDSKKDNILFAENNREYIKEFSVEEITKQWINLIEQTI